VLATGEAHALMVQAMSGTDPTAMARIHEQFLVEYYGSIQTTLVSPQGASILADMEANATWFDSHALYAAGMSVAAATDALRQALETTAPFDSPGLDVMTPHGRIVVSTADEDTTYEVDALADAAIVIDLAGNDTYGGRYASTHHHWMSASVLVDMAGDDLYTPETADIEDSSTRNFQAFDNLYAFTQGSGLFGVGVLVDAAGTDRYTASNFSQGSGAFGVGLLVDLDGADDYRLGSHGQGMGYFGIGIALDTAGDDRYGVYTLGQGAGKPLGHGLLLDTAGHDTYISYYQALEPDLPGPGYNNYYSLTSSWSYSDDAGNPHFMSNSQGVGWGYRTEWTEGDNWAGGFGALMDLGDGDDTHYGDCMVMGQGFVYGFDYLYDGGGNDVYRTFW
jgi:hypothetical protein